ncbi:hypothetical protein K7I13_00665 [Brucepastera parasyntrophica]|uniref:tetratricopeptide repeat protein n=1 Tax=Brucepastera parasyntrophica TaxID=2880008 RepID=UPI0021089C44|nr:hypothetical protein [Brucepastera parasyntrophica]ULQ59898.1 hypothetical protein K7I13_00665 [Brucepastera parasyntrophica]
MGKTALEKAKQAFSGKRYSDVITLLEPYALDSDDDQYKDSFQFYLYLGLACLHTGDAGGAASYFERARRIRLRDPDLLTAQAALYLRQRKTSQAVEYYLEALQYAPSHRLAKKSLEFIRKNGDEDTISELIETGKIRRFYPRPKVKRSVSVPAVLGCCLLVAAAVVVFAFIAKNNSPSQERADLSAFELNSDDRKAPVELGGTYRYIMTESEVLQAYAKVQRLFQEYRDNAAQVEINRLLYSNASAEIRRKARLLMEYLGEPGFDTIRDSYSYAEVNVDPNLYLDCWVVWKGMATNIRRTDNTVDFDLLVGYDTRQRLEGIVPVHFNTVLEVDPDKPLEVLGQLTLENGKPALKGGSIFQTGRPRSM